jgi:hypothetical protein
VRGLRDVTAGGVQLQGARVVPVVHQPSRRGDGRETGGAPAAGRSPAVDAESALHVALPGGEEAAAAEAARGEAGAGGVEVAAA